MNLHNPTADIFIPDGKPRAEALAFAMDLTPLVHDNSLDILDYVTGFIDRFKADVIAKLGRRLGK